MQWWVLIPVVSMLTGPAALYLMTRNKRRVVRAEERYEELARRYDELLDARESERRALPDRHDR